MTGEDVVVAVAWREPEADEWQDVPCVKTRRQRGGPRRAIDHPTDPTALLIPLGNGYFATIDRADYPKVAHLRWTVRFRKHLCYAVNDPGKGKPSTRMHRLILNAAPGLRVDHRDGDGLNNRRRNLRTATHIENMRNQKLRSDSKTGRKGVRLCPGSGGRWMARICVNKQRIYLGRYPTLEEAAAAYDAAAKSYFGEFAKTNEAIDAAAIDDMQAAIAEIKEQERP